MFRQVVLISSLFIFSSSISFAGQKEDIADVAKRDYKIGMKECTKMKVKKDKVSCRERVRENTNTVLRFAGQPEISEQQAQAQAQAQAQTQTQTQTKGKGKGK